MPTFNQAFVVRIVASIITPTQQEERLWLTKWISFSILSTVPEVGIVVIQFDRGGNEAKDFMKNQKHIDFRV